MHHELGGDCHPERQPVHHHRPWHHPEEADDPFFVILVYQRRQLVVAPGIVEEYVADVPVELAGRAMLRPPEHQPVQVRDLPQVGRVDERTYATHVIGPVEPPGAVSSPWPRRAKHGWRGAGARWR